MEVRSSRAQWNSLDRIHDENVASRGPQSCSTEQRYQKMTQNLKSKSPIQISTNSHSALNWYRQWLRIRNFAACMTIARDTYWRRKDLRMRVLAQVRQYYNNHLQRHFTNDRTNITDDNITKIDFCEYTPRAFRTHAFFVAFVSLRRELLGFQ